jgi:Anti-sigma-K factor rskA
MMRRMEERDPSTVAIEQRTADLQLQIEQVNVTVRQLRQTHDSLHDMGQRLSSLTSECEGILERWAKNDDQHAAAVVELHSRLSEWNDLERKLVAESAARIHQFERGLQHEWQALRKKHEEPLQKLDAETTRITETCLTAVDQATRGLDRAEARLTVIEQELYRQMGDLTREVRAAVAELRQAELPAGSRRPWSLDEVVRVHGELRAEANDAPGLAFAGVGGTATAGLPATIAPPASSAISLLQDGKTSPSASEFSEEPEAVTPPATGVWWRGTVLGLVVAAGVLGGYAWHLRNRMETGLRDAATRAEAAERGAVESRELASQQIAAVQRTAQAQITTAQQAAQSAQTLATVLSAPDLRRIDLSNEGLPGVSAQVLLSRSRGVIFSASRLPALRPERVYQLWLIAEKGPVSVGTVQPDASGRASVVFDPPSVVPRPLMGANLTLEPGSGSSRPTGPVYLSWEPLAARASSP